MKQTLKIFWPNLLFYKWDPQRRSDLAKVSPSVGRASTKPNFQLSLQRKNKKLCFFSLLTRQESVASQRKTISVQYILRLFRSTCVYISAVPCPWVHVWHWRMTFYYYPSGLFRCLKVLLNYSYMASTVNHFSDQAFM